VRALAGLVEENDVGRGELVVSELVTNAIRHGSPDETDDIVVELAAQDGRLCGSIGDRGPTFTGLDEVDVRTAGGFGLHIVDELTESWSIHPEGSGNDVRFRL